MIWHQNLSNMAKKAKKKITFDAKSSIGPCGISLLRLMKRTLDVSKRNKNCGKNPLCISYKKNQMDGFSQLHCAEKVEPYCALLLLCFRFLHCVVSGEARAKHVKYAEWKTNQSISSTHHLLSVKASLALNGNHLVLQSSRLRDYCI